MMAVNEGSIDRTLRVLLGVALVSLAVFKGVLWGWIGVVPIMTGALGWCPLYTVLGINTCGTKKA